MQRAKRSPVLKGDFQEKLTQRAVEHKDETVARVTSGISEIFDSYMRRSPGRGVHNHEPRAKIVL